MEKYVKIQFRLPLSRMLNPDKPVVQLSKETSSGIEMKYCAESEPRKSVTTTVVPWQKLTAKRIVYFIRSVIISICLSLVVWQKSMN